MNGGAFEDHWKKCRDCMRGKNESFILGNCEHLLPFYLLEKANAGYIVITNMGQACESKPKAAKKETLDLPQPLFATEVASGTQPTTSSPTATESSESSGSSGSSGLSKGASAGIGVGVGVGAIVLLSATWFFVRRHRRNKQETNPTSLHAVHDVYMDSKYMPQQQSYPHGSVMSEAGGTPRAELPT